jgi:hypothetical protein
MCVCPNGGDYQSVVRKHQALVDSLAFSLLQLRIVCAVTLSIKWCLSKRLVIQYKADAAHSE